MRIEIKDEDVFIPESLGNKELPNDEQVRVNLNAPTKAIREAVKPESKLRMEFDKDGIPIGGFVEAEIREDVMLRRMIRSIDNLSYCRKGKTINVTSHKDFPDVPPKLIPMVQEISNYIQNLLFSRDDEEEEKN